MSLYFNSLFYEDHIHLFNDASNFFCQFMKNDHSLFSEILTTRTEIKLRKIQIQISFLFIKAHLSQNLPKLDMNNLELVHLNKIQLPLIFLSFMKILN